MDYQRLHTLISQFLDKKGQGYEFQDTLTDFARNLPRRGKPDIIATTPFGQMVQVAAMKWGVLQTGSNFKNVIDNYGFAAAMAAEEARLLSILRDKEIEIPGAPMPLNVALYHAAALGRDAPTFVKHQFLLRTALLVDKEQQQVFIESATGILFPPKNAQDERNRLSNALTSTNKQRALTEPSNVHYEYARYLAQEVQRADEDCSDDEVQPPPPLPPGGSYRYGIVMDDTLAPALTHAYGSSDEHTTWGRMETIHRNLPTRVSGYIVGRSMRPSIHGIRPMYLQRYCSDKHVMGMNMQAPGGTVLVDWSGSMGLEASAVETIIRLVPGITLAFYSGYTNDDGALHIIMRNGRCIDLSQLDDGYKKGGGNIVDGPALQWLGAQPRPRLWVSDGGVTGVGDRSANHLADEARAIIKAKKIKQLTNIEAVIEFSKRQTRRTYVENAVRVLV